MTKTELNGWNNWKRNCSQSHRQCASLKEQFDITIQSQSSEIKAHSFLMHSYRSQFIDLESIFIHLMLGEEVGVFFLCFFFLKNCEPMTLKVASEGNSEVVRIINPPLGAIKSDTKIHNCGLWFNLAVSECLPLQTWPTCIDCDSQFSLPERQIQQPGRWPSALTL